MVGEPLSKAWVQLVSQQDAFFCQHQKSWQLCRTTDQDKKNAIRTQNPKFNLSRNIEHEVIQNRSEKVDCTLKHKNEPEQKRLKNLKEKNIPRNESGHGRDWISFLSF